MQIRRLPSIVASVLALALAVPFAAAEPYKADPAHSSLVFRAKHLDTSYVYGRFDSFSATVTYDESNPDKLAIEASADVKSVNTGQAKRDEHLKSTTFFAAEEFPKITFKSTSAKTAGGNDFEVTGDLTLHGQTKPITVKLTKVGSSNNARFGQRVGWLTTFTVKRSEFGMGAMTEMVGDEVELTVSLETARTK